MAVVGADDAGDAARARCCARGSADVSTAEVTVPGFENLCQAGARNRGVGRFRFRAAAADDDITLDRVGLIYLAEFGCIGREVCQWYGACCGVDRIGPMRARSAGGGVENARAAVLK